MADVKQMFVVLQDASGQVGAAHRFCPVTVEYGKDSICLLPHGYGQCECADGFGAPVIVEYYEGRLRVIVWADINNPEPQIIDLEGARDSCRVEEKYEEET